MRDDSKVNYYSGWDIDQLVVTDDVAVGAGDTLIYTIPTTSTPIPVCDVQFRPGAGSKFYQAGKYATANTLATVDVFYSYVQGNGLYIHTGINGIARYFIYSDKVDY